MYYLFRLYYYNTRGGFRILLINYRPNSYWYSSIRWLKILHIWRSEISSSRRLQEFC